MYDTQLYFYLMNFYLKDFILSHFKNEILMLFNNEDPLYYFDKSNNYNIYLLDSKGKILCKLPFKLYSLNDKEDIIEDVYNMIIDALQNYLSSFVYDEYPSNIVLYISICDVNALDIESLWLHINKCKDNICKMKSDLLLPISKIGNKISQG